MTPDQPDLVKLLREEAEACRKNTTMNGEYSAAFWVVNIILENLAKRIESPGAQP